MKTGQRFLLGLGLGLALVAGSARAAPMGTAFTYQGFLEDGGGPVTATCDFEFSLWDDQAAGTEEGNSPQSVGGVDVEDGLFTVAIDFDSGAFNGDARWLGIKVCCPTTACALETLDPRVELTPAPQAIRALEGVGPPNALEVSSDGKVGIGTAPEPSRSLYVVGSDTGAAFIVGDFPTFNDTRLVGVWEGNGVPPQVRYTNNDSANFIDVGQNGSGDFVIEANNQPRLTVQLDGKVGIGTTNPGELLDVDGNIHATGTISSGASITIDGTANTIDSTGDLAIQSSGGNVGIGTTTPNAKLEVAGTIHSTSGGFKFPDGTVQSSAATGAPGGTGARNPLQIALLRWYEANESRATFSVSAKPEGVAFDGANIWVVNLFDNDVTKLRASDGALLGTFNVGNLPVGVAFDGANIWVTNFGDDNVTKLRASDGVEQPGSPFNVGSNPSGVAFDGVNIWVANHGSNTVTKLRASDGALLGTFSVGSLPRGVAFDGANIWVTNNSSDDVTKLRASDGTVLGTFSVGNSPVGVAFDGANIWVTNSSDGTVSKL